MLLVLCDSNDVPARWAFDGLRAGGPGPVELVTTDALAHARLVQHVGSAGVRSSLRLADGRAFDGGDVRGVLNRLLHPPLGDLLLIQPSDRSYVAQELMAILSGWLHSLEAPLVNPPAPECLSGRLRPLAEWLWLAGRAGLPVPRHRLSSRDASAPPALHARVPGAGCCLRTVFVVGRRAVGDPAPDAVVDGCLRLADLARTPLLGVELSVDAAGAWQVAGVSARPDLRRGGAALVEALADAFRKRAAA